MSYRGARILITGGLGFIGSNLARSLVRDGAIVEIVDSLQPEFGGNRHNVADIADAVAITIGDVRNRDLMKKAVVDKDFIFNLAAQTSHVDSMRKPFEDLQINAEAQLALAEECRAGNPGVRIVYTSTRQLYGRPCHLPVGEAHPIRPVDINGVSKLAGEHFHLLYHDIYGVRACVLRLTNTFGPGMRIKDARQTFIGIWVRKLLEGSPIPIFGDGQQLRDFTYVDDCVEALRVAGLAESAYGRVFNIGGGAPISLLELARMMIGLGYGGSIDLQPFPPERKAIDIGDYYSDDSQFRQQFGWAPRIELQDGLKRTLDFYRANLPHYV